MVIKMEFFPNRCFVCDKLIGPGEEYICCVIQKEIKSRKGKIEVLGAQALVIWCADCFDEMMERLRAARLEP